MGFKLPAMAGKSMTLKPGTGSAERLYFEISGDSIKAVTSRGAGAMSRVLSVQAQSLGGEDAQAAKFLSEILQHRKIRLKQAIAVLPASVFICKNVDMPSDNRDEIAKIIDLQAGRFTPYAAEEIAMDYICHTVEDQHYTNVLLFIVTRQVLERYLRIAAGAGIEITRFQVGSEAIAAQLLAQGALNTAGSAEGFVNVFAEGTDILVADRGKVVFVRSLPTTRSELEAGGAEAAAQLAEEIQKSLAGYADLGFGKPLKKLLLSNSANIFSKLSGPLEKLLPEISVALFNPVEHLKADPSVLETLNAENGLQYLGLITAAQGHPLVLELTPREIKAQRKIREESRDLLKLGMLVMTLALLGIIFLFGKIHFKTLLIGKLNAIYEETFDEARYLERISTKSRAVRSLLETRGRGLYVFDKVTGLLGPEIYLKEFTFDHEGNLALKGTADSMSSIFALVKHLEESNYFETVKTNETKSRREGKEEVADFDLTCKLKEGI